MILIALKFCALYVVYVYLTILTYFEAYRNNDYKNEVIITIRTSWKQYSYPHEWQDYSLQVST